MSLLEIRELSVTLAGRTVVEPTDLDVEAGEFVGLLGPNGAGKTTLMRAVLGLVPATGRASLAGATGRALRRCVGYVPQRHDVNWDYPLSVHACVLGGRLGLRPVFRGPGETDYTAAAEALARVGLSALAGRTIGELSGGQRQRVLVARALVRRPDLLLLDEPFTGLDHPATEELLGLFARLCAEGTTVVMSTHNLPEAQHSCSRLILFNRTVRADAAPDSSLLRSTEPWTATFGVRPESPLLASLGVGPGREEAAAC
ncbi:anchored repeat-type ABC transporter ATP-binding subunit [Corynebacterium frankenforstense]